MNTTKQLTFLCLRKRRDIPNIIDALHDRPGITKATLRRGMKEFLQYVNTTYMSLLELEEKECGSPSSISLFCRFDVGVMEGADGEYNFYVHDVERGCVVLFGELMPTDLNPMLAQWGEVLAVWIQQNTHRLK